MRRVVAIVGTIFLACALWTAPAYAGAVPDKSHAFGNSRAGWAEEYTQWVFGDSSNPIVSGECGALVDGAYFLTTPTDINQEFECTVPLGVPIILSHAAYFAWVPTDGSTDDEIEATSVALFGSPKSSLTLDGRSVPLATTQTGAFNVNSQPGSAYDAVFDLGTGPIRTAVTGQFTVLHPLRPGKHQIVADVDFNPTGGPIFGVTYNIMVR